MVNHHGTLPQQPVAAWSGPTTIAPSLTDVTKLSCSATSMPMGEVSTSSRTVDIWAQFSHR